jgi:hypothetical protein
MDNPEKLATSGTQDEEKQNKNTTQYVLETIMPLRYSLTTVYLSIYLYPISFKNVSGNTI